MRIKHPVIPKSELYRVIEKFIKDENRGISIELFAELCGVSEGTLTKVFIYREYPMTEMVQRRVSRGYKSWLKGEVAIMQNHDRSRFVQYKKEPKPRVVRSMGLQVVNGEIKMQIGLRNKADYSDYTLDEQLRGK